MGLACNPFNGNHPSHLEKPMKKLIVALMTTLFAVGAFTAQAPTAASRPMAASTPTKTATKKATKKHHHKKAKKAAAAASAASK